MIILDLQLPLLALFFFPPCDAAGVRKRVCFYHLIWAVGHFDLLTYLLDDNSYT